MLCSKTRKVLVIWPREEFGDFIVEVRLDGLSTAQMRVDDIDMRYEPGINWALKCKQAVAEERFYSASSLEY